MAGHWEMSSSRRPVSLLAIAILLCAIALCPATAVPANNFADLKRLLADTSVSRIEVKSDIKLTEDLPLVSRSIRITGQCPRGRQCVVDGDSKYRIFLISSQGHCRSPTPRLHVDISNLRLINARANSVEITDCGSYMWNNGAALSLIVVASTTLRTVNFEDNEADRGGGLAITEYPTLRPTGTVFIDKCVFRDNRAGTAGGAIHLDGGMQTTITSSTFIRNSITSDSAPSYARRGGAVDGNSGYLVLIGCRFQNNTNDFGLGGAVDVGSTSGRIDFQSNTFEGNSAKEGGAISAWHGGVSICKNTFKNNVATGPDSAARRSSNVLVVLNGQPAKFCPSIPAGTRTVCQRDYKGLGLSALPHEPCTVSDHVRVICGKGGRCLPRGVDIRTPTGRLTSFLLNEKLTKLTLRENVVLTEGLPYPSLLRVKPFTITGNCPRSRGGRCVIDGRGKFTTFTFHVNVTMENIEIRRAALTAVEANDGFVGRNLVFAQNRRPRLRQSLHDGPGTAGLDVIGNFSISNCIFTENSGYFAALSATDADGDGFTRGVVSRCTFSKNVAERNGGAVDFFGRRDKTVYRVADSTFTGNTAAGGWVIQATAGQLEIVRSTFKNNLDIESDVEAIRSDENEKLSVCNCQFSGNSGKKGNSTNLHVLQATQIPTETLFCPTQPPLTEFNCNHNGEFDEPIPCHPITIGGPACARCR